MNLFYKEKLCEVLQKNNVDAILIAPGEELEFILGHTTHICERFQALFIKASGEYFYVCNKLTEDEIKNLSAMLLEKALDKMSEPAKALLMAAGVDISAIITGAGEAMIGAMKK